MTTRTKAAAVAETPRALLDSAISSPAETPPETPTTLLCAVWIPGHPVSVNAMYGARRGTYAKRLTDEATVWRDAIANSLLRYRVPERQRRQPLAVSFMVVGVRGDADNYAKLVCDGVKIGLLVDDRYFLRVTAAKRKADYRGEQGVAIYVTRLSAPVQLSAPVFTDVDASMQMHSEPLARSKPTPRRKGAA